MSFINSKSEAIRKLQAKLFNSRFFTVSVLLHLLLLLVVGGTVIYKQATIPDDFTGGGETGDSFITKESAAPPPPPPSSEVTPTVPDNNTAIEAIRTDNDTATAFVPPVITPTLINAPVENKVTIQAPKTNSNSLSREQIQKIGDFTGGWNKKGKGGRGTSPKDREIEFVAYLAKYEGGDWNSTNIIKDGKIVKGSLPNLLYFMGRLSKGKIKANPIAEPLELSSQDIFVKKPPFIFFTGHRDFVLTDKEVENLRAYIQLGGCVWGDSSLPGRRSRFDLAFRREMRRVIPDEDKQWDVILPTDPLYKRHNTMYFPEIQAPPAGVNHYAEPVYTLRFGGEVAVIYTANDYGDMWRIGLTDKLVIDKTLIPRSWEFMFTDNGIFERMEIYYRGMELTRIINSYKFGTNVVFHLVTRWEDRVKTPPAGL